LRAVIFDFGGVLVRTASQATREALCRRLGCTPEALESLVFGGADGYRVQRGEVSDAEHWRWIGRRLGLSEAEAAQVHDEYFAEDFLDGKLLAYAGALRRAGLHVGLLSNAGSDARRMFAEEFGILDHFDSVTISGEEGVMKPDPRIYRIALDRAGVAPKEAVFVDDVSANVEAAEALGMAGVQFRSTDQAIRALEALTGVKNDSYEEGSVMAARRPRP
jgi:putative hydrolase of the HAD superfamily